MNQTPEKVLKAADKAFKEARVVRAEAEAAKSELQIEIEEGWRRGGAFQGSCLVCIDDGKTSRPCQLPPTHQDELHALGNADARGVSIS